MSTFVFSADEKENYRLNNVLVFDDKVIKKEDLGSFRFNELLINKFLMERGGHESICRPMHIFYYKNEINYGFSKYIPLNNKTRLTDTEFCQIVVDILTGLEFLHEHYIYHRDVKMSNVVLTNDKRAKIIDFGHSVFAQCESELNSMVYSTAERPPEVFKYHKLMNDSSPLTLNYYDHNADIWAFGMLIFHMLTGCRFIDNIGLDEKNLEANYENFLLNTNQNKFNNKLYNIYVRRANRKLRYRKEYFKWIKCLLKINPKNRLCLLNLLHTITNFCNSNGIQLKINKKIPRSHQDPMQDYKNVHQDHKMEKKKLINDCVKFIHNDYLPVYSKGYFHKYFYKSTIKNLIENDPYFIINMLYTFDYQLYVNSLALSIALIIDSIIDDNLFDNNPYYVIQRLREKGKPVPEKKTIDIMITEISKSHLVEMFFGPSVYTNR